MDSDLISEIVRFLRFRPDPLRNGSEVLCLLIFLGGVILLGGRVRGAWRGAVGAPLSLVACRMTAVLGALGGFVIYLRDLPRSGARLGLLLGGVSALPWVAVIALELARGRGRSRAGKGDPPGRPGNSGPRE